MRPEPEPYPPDRGGCQARAPAGGFCYPSCHASFSGAESSMGIVGEFPEKGVRIEVERPVSGGPPWCYAGYAVVPAARFAMTAIVSAGGDVRVELPSGAPEGLADRVRLILRAAYRHAEKDAVPPARRVVRWRADGP